MTNQIVVDYIKNMVISGEMKVGDKLPPERQLAEQLNVSRNVVREALRKLDVLGLVKSEQGSGNYITNDYITVSTELLRIIYATSNATYRDFTNYRLGLDLMAFTLAVDNISEKQLKKMENLVREMDQMTDINQEQNIRKFVAADKKLHMIQAESSGNQFLLNNYYALSAVMDTYMYDTRSYFLRVDGTESVQEPHRRMVEALREKDTMKGRSAIDDHYKALQRLKL